MNANLVVTDYMEAPLLLLAWIVNNSLWNTLMMTGLAAVPFIAMMVSEWFRARREGDDEGNRGKVAINRIETGLYAMVLCYAFTCLPLLDVSINPANNIPRLDDSGNVCSVAVVGEGEWGSATLNSMAGQTASIPLWWAFVHILSKGLTNTAVAAIPCTPDWQSIATEVDLQEIEDQVLQLEVSEFQLACYGAARNKLFREQPNMDRALANDTAWLGSQHLLNTPGLYDSFYAPRPIQGFPYVEARDSARSNTGPGQPGYPSCSEWWSDSVHGLRQRLYEEVNPSLWTSIQAAVGVHASAEEAVIRRMVSPREGAANGRHLRPVAGYRDIGGGGRVENAIDAVTGVASGMVGSVGGGVYVAKGKAGMDMLKMALPMVQAVLVMAVIIPLPLIMVMSGYSLTVAGTATFGLFAIWFLTFWWELARWLSNNLITMLYSGGASTTGALETAFGIANLYDKSLLVMIEWAMFLLLPMIWMAVMAWAGFKAGNQISSQLSAGTKGAQGAGDEASSQAMSAATKGKLR
ncbi:conjugal transfer protein TraG N-terminal domain-containing protein [Halopseudomonas bauzanensis]|uniref:conjugal transfer protein TraG N-terminal domain-containing protein n=1 Tax=Halopseudomonas bauzanensis TaxID=653930 RepID=UPI0025576132|nr:conjugal transfer protein TraG N-terminal domain-containing protein [Halopseudomonas bauzanensis]